MAKIETIRIGEKSLWITRYPDGGAHISCGMDGETALTGEEVSRVVALLKSEENDDA